MRHKREPTDGEPGPGHVIERHKGKTSSAAVSTTAARAAKGAVRERHAVQTPITAVSGRRGAFNARVKT